MTTTTRLRRRLVRFITFTLILTCYASRWLCQASSSNLPVDGIQSATTKIDDEHFEEISIPFNTASSYIDTVENDDDDGFDHNMPFQHEATHSYEETLPLLQSFSEVARAVARQPKTSSPPTWWNLLLSPGAIKLISGLAVQMGMAGLLAYYLLREKSSLEIELNKLMIKVEAQDNQVAEFKSIITDMESGYIRDRIGELRERCRSLQTILKQLQCQQS